MKRGFFEAVATLIGTTIGAGILAIPFAVSKVGLVLGLILIAAFGLITLVFNVLLGKVAIATKGIHQLNGYATIYLGKKWGILMTITNTLFIYGAMSAYLFGISEIINSYIPLAKTISGLLFFVIVASIIFLGLKVFEKSELALGIIMVLLLIIISVSGFFIQKATPSLSIKMDWHIFGVLIFAYLGGFAIPEMKEELKGRRLYIKSIIIGTIITTLLYMVFSAGVFSITGSQTTQVASIGLEAVSPILGSVANLIALLCITTTFLALGYSLKETYMYDYKFNENVSTLLACLPPLIPFLLNLTGFAELIAITGILFGGIIYFMLALVFFRFHQQAL